MHTQTHTAESPELTHELFADLLDHTLTTFHICHKHNLAIDQLEAVADSPAFQSAARALERIHDARAAAMLPELRTRALTQLAHIIDQTPTTPTHTETVRRATATVLRWKPAPRPTTEEPTEQQTEKHTKNQAENPTQDAPGQPHAQAEPTNTDTRPEPTHPPESQPDPAHAPRPATPLNAETPEHDTRPQADRPPSQGHQPE